MYQFFVDPLQIEEKYIHITGQDVNHIKNVLRMKQGEELNVSNGIDSREFRCRIEEFYDNEVLCKLEFIKEADVELPCKVYLFQGLPKNDKMELIIQKAVELGVYQVIPVAMKRSVVKLDAKKEKTKVERWNTIAQAAAKQSKRMMIPEVTKVMTMMEAVAYAANCQVRLVPYELAKGMDQTREILGNVQQGQDIAIFIGPEGGFDEDEIAEASKAGILPITLGRRILRTETAGMTVLSWLVYLLEK